ncbi:MAG: sulfotransferase [Phycisphaerales bacterium]
MSESSFDIPKMLQEAVAHQRAGRRGRAERLYRTILERRPDNPNALHLLGVLIADSGRPDAAVPYLTRAVDAAPGEATFRVNLGAALRKAGRLSESVATFDAALGLDAGNVAAHYGRAHALEEMHRLPEALAAAEETLRLQPGHALARTLAARIDRRAGRFESARARLEPLVRSAASVEVRCHASIELGQALDRLGRYAEAFEVLESGQRAQAERIAGGPLDGRGYLEFVRGLTAQLDAADAASWSSFGEDDGLPTPTFLVGFPRSGTTMTEQILGAHDSVRTTDEQAYVGRAIRRLQSTNDAPPRVETLSGADLATLRRAYWEEVSRADPAAAAAAQAGVSLLDKLPLNLVNLAFIHRMFPEAKILLALRDPRDVCLSCFMQTFDLNAAMSCFLRMETTAALYEAVMTLWTVIERRIAPNVLQVRYEDTVTDLEGQSRRILEFLGLRWDAALLTFHERARERRISTPSYEAVTNPVHSGAIGRWRHYEQWMAPHLPRLAPFVERFGYSDA